MLAGLRHLHTVSIGGMAGDLEWSRGAGSFRITAEANTAAEVNEEFNEKQRRKIDAAPVRGAPRARLGAPRRQRLSTADGISDR